MRSPKTRTDTAATEVSRSIQGRNFSFKKSEASEVAAAPGCAWRDSNSPAGLPAVAKAESRADGKVLMSTGQTVDADVHHRNYKRWRCGCMRVTDERRWLLQHRANPRKKQEYY